MLENALTGRRCAPPGQRLRSAPPVARQPRRLHRIRGRKAARPEGAIYVGRPSLWANPFARPGIGHARSVILYRAWLAGELGHGVLQRLRFSEDEIAALARWRRRVLDQITTLAGHDLQCWCPLTSPWCHADVLLALANRANDA